MIEELYDNLTVVDATQADWRDQIFRLIGPREPHTLAPLNSILNLATSLGVKTVVLEAEYVDSCFLDEFQSYYCKQFRSLPHKCTRLHFFEARFRKKELPDLDLAAKGYLGFSVVRPILSFSTGRTILKSSKADRDSAYTLCKAHFEVNLSGKTLSITGMPFIQQDTNVSVCAQAALWMTSLYMHQRFLSPHFSPSEITLAATRSLTIGPVRRGLIPEQVLAALRDMGLEPLIFTHYDPQVTARLIYAYVESELPVILLLQVAQGGHAVVVIGHDFHRRTKPLTSWNSNIHWIDCFYVHDDAIGPYRDLFIDKVTSQYSIEEHAAYVVVPVPPAVTMQANDVFDHIAILKERLNSLIDLFGPNARSFRFSAMELTGLIFRTYLRPSNIFKAQLSPYMSKLFRHRYRSMRMPRYIWVTEVSKARYINKTRSQNRKIIGEIVIDSTADRHAHLKSYLAIHLLGRMITRRPEEDQPRTLYIDPTEGPYGHLVR